LHYTVGVFTQGTATIDRSVEEVYAFIADMNKQLECWEMLYIPELGSLADEANETAGSFQQGGKTHRCEIELYRTRPGAGLVTRVKWDSGELAAEWRVMDFEGRTKLELNIEGHGGGLAVSVTLRQMAPRILGRLKQSIDKA
jgi:hypothetical protein